MPIYIVHEGTCTGASGTSSQKHASENVFARSNRFRQHPALQISENEKDNPLSQSLDKSKEINRTYVLSARNELSDALATVRMGDKLTLQRRTVTFKEQSDANATNDSDKKTQKERKLMLQRRTRPVSTEQSQTNNTYEAMVENAESVPQKNNTVFQPKASNNDPPPLKADLQLLKGHMNAERIPDLKKDLLFNQNSSNGTGRCTPLKHRTFVAESQSQRKVPKSLLLIPAKPESKTPLLKVPENFSFNKENGSENLQNKSVKTTSLERQKTPRKGTGERIGSMPKCGLTPCAKTPASTVKNKAHYFSTISQKKTSTSSSLSLNCRNGKMQENAACSRSASFKGDAQMCIKDDPFKVENSKVTVAVRVRPFSIRFV